MFELEYLLVALIAALVQSDAAAFVPHFDMTRIKAHFDRLTGRRRRPARSPVRRHAGTRSLLARSPVRRVVANELAPRSSVLPPPRCVRQSRAVHLPGRRRAAVR